jgi:integration host factor subunit beta
MIKSELVKRVVAQNPRLRKHDIQRIVNALLGEIVAALTHGDRVELRGFGIFSVRHYPAHTACNPKTRVPLAIEERSKPFFKPSREVRRRLNRSEA